MVAWHARVFGDTRSRILELLRDAPRTAVALAAELGLTNNAIRQHLAGLGAHGLVEHSGILRDTGGKPAQLYSLSATGEELFPKGYAPVLTGLIDELESLAGGPSSKEIFIRTGERLASAVRVPSGADFSARIHLAADGLRALGGDMEVEQQGDEWQLRARGCPLAAVVAERPVACELVRAYIRKITAGIVSECCGKGAGCGGESAARANCLFRVRASETSV